MGFNSGFKGLNTIPGTMGTH